MRVSVVIPAYNEEKNIGTCLDYLLNQEEKPDEIIVVDNNSKDKTAQIAKKYGARVVVEKIQGMIPARNAGFNAAKYEVIARTDADTMPPKDWILKIKKYFKDSDLGAISGPAAYFGIPAMSALSLSFTFFLFQTVGLTLGHPILFGPNMALRKSAWEKVKNDVCLKDSDVHEDVDLSIHLNPITIIKFDWNFSIRTVRGRWLKIMTVYVTRFIKMLQTHRKLIKQNKASN